MAFDTRVPPPAEVISRKDAVARGLPRYFTGKPCKRGHLAWRAAVNCVCYDCQILKTRAYAAINADKVRASIARARARYQERKPNAATLAKAAYRERNKELLREKGREYVARNKDAMREYKRAHRKEKSWIYAEEQRRRQFRKKQATPTWANIDAIQEIYASAAQMSRATGIKHAVDHIVPLVNELVCGLHVEENLQVITFSENSRKRNRFAVE